MFIDRDSKELRIIYDISTETFYRAEVTYYKNEGRPPYEVKIISDLGKNPTMIHNTEVLALRIDHMKGGEGNRIKTGNVYHNTTNTLKGV